MPSEPLTYRDAGVDLEEAERSLRAVADSVRATYTPSVIAGIGSFGGLFAANFSDFERPILVSSIDGVGTKTKVAAMVGDYSGIGYDIVNHCVNDILCQGAKPLFFLDYFGCSKLSAPVFESVVIGAADACTKCECALIGGETAEMPGTYLDDEVDVVGCIVGVVDAEKKLPRGKMQTGNALIGIASNGLHTNGYSLARRALFEVGGFSVRDEVPGLGTTIGEELLRPHRCYLESVYPILQDSSSILGVAHITGGGLFGNLPRVMPADVRAVIDRRSWTPLPIFSLIQEAGSIPDVEMYHAFNMGIGMVIICSNDAAPAICQRLNQAGEMAAVIGEIQSGSHDVQIL